MIGEGSTIGGNAFVTSSVPANTTVLMKNPELAEAILTSMVKKLHKPVTVKFRKGFDDSCVNAVLARIIQDEEYHIMLLQMLIKEL